MSSSEATERIELAVFESRLAALCETMGAVLRRAAFSPNIRDRLDYSCALFDARGALLNQATHIPVHLGSMAWAMRDLVDRFDWRPGDRLILNDPYAGGTHLPDVTLIAPIFHDDKLAAFVANRAHHADIGTETPGSMPLSQTLDEEGVLIEPTWLYRDGKRDEEAFEAICAPMRDPALAAADFQAQVAASASGERALEALVEEYGQESSPENGLARFRSLCDSLNAYAERLAAAALQALPRGRYRAEDAMDDDGAGGPGPVLRVSVEVGDEGLRVDFAGTDPAVPGNLNCPMSVTAAGVFYVVRCLLPDATPACAGAMARLRLEAPPGCLVHAQRPSATAAGNVETSQRIVDVLLRALASALPDRIPAASQGTMNNLGLGSDRWSYYETQAGGCGASPGHAGRSAVHSHMTNTLNTPAEVLERHFPLRLIEYRVRRGSGGNGRQRGGDGLVRAFEFLEPAEVTLITERRRLAPWGLQGGEDGRAGANMLDDTPLPAKAGLRVEAGQTLRIETPGGGGHGAPNA